MDLSLNDLLVLRDLMIHVDEYAKQYYNRLDAHERELLERIKLRISELS